MSVFRSFLFAPGNHARRVEKCLTVGADAVILDPTLTLSLPPHVQIVAVDLAIELEQLSFAVTNKLARAAVETGQMPATGDTTTA